MQTYTVIGFYEDNDQETYAGEIEAPNPAQAGIAAAELGVSIVAIIPGHMPAGILLPEFAGNFTCSNGMDGADEITDEERDAT